MPPPNPSFSVTDLPQRVHSQLDPSGQRTKSRKLSRDFSLQNCELMELVQYSCTPWREMIPRQLEGRGQECWPVVRLFRRCRDGEKVFHVETTAWEGEGAWAGKPSVGKSTSSTDGDGGDKGIASTDTSRNLFADYGSYFWNKQS